MLLRLKSSPPSLKYELLLRRCVRFLPSCDLLTLRLERHFFSQRLLNMKLPSMPKIYNVYFLAIVATMGGMLFGFDISSMSAIIGTSQYR